MQKKHLLFQLQLVVAAIAAPIVSMAQSSLSVVAQGDTVTLGSSAQLTAAVAGGTAPYTVEWRNGLRQVVASAQIEADGTAQADYQPTECDDYQVSVTDANGLTAADTCRVVLTGEAVAATMENLWLDNETAWAGPDTKGESVMGTWGDTQLAGSFVSGSYSFSNNYSLDWGSWSGFGYSNSTSTKYESLADQYNSVVGSGHNGSSNFVVAYSEGTISVLNNAEGDTIQGFYITGSAYAHNSIINGDAYSQAFTTGSWLAATFTGTHADGTTDTLTYYLADYRSDNAADHYTLDTWQWVDLRSLGSITKLSFTIDGSDKSYGYLNTPAYFCLDDFNGTREQTTAPVQTTRSVDVAGMFGFDASAATIAYAMPDAAYDGTAAMATLSADGVLTLSDDVAGDVTIVVSATQCGKTQYVAVPFSVSTGISSVEATTGSRAQQIFDMSGRRISTLQPGLNIVRRADGTAVKVVVRR